MNIAVVVASVGRPTCLAALVANLETQTASPNQIILSVESNADLPTLASDSLHTENVQGPRGLCAQRNRGLNRLADEIDLVAFFDDDYVPSRYAIERISKFFEDFPDISGIEGIVLRDGAKGPGISYEDARLIVENEDSRLGIDGLEMRPLDTKLALYGCNMVFRTSAIRDLRFDEKLPLYGWLEDLDFGSRIEGRLASSNAFWGVHCGEKTGREASGRKLGYSQIANPAYMVRKGTLSRVHAFSIMARNMMANNFRALRPEPWVNRRGRAAGNWLALKDALNGRIEPMRILDL